MFPRSGISGGSHWSEPQPQNLLALHEKNPSVWAKQGTGFFHGCRLEFARRRLFLPSILLIWTLTLRTPPPKKSKKIEPYTSVCYLRHAFQPSRQSFFFTPTFRFFSSPRRPADAALTAAAEVEDKQRPGNLQTVARCDLLPRGHFHFPFRDVRDWENWSHAALYRVERKPNPII